MTLLYLYAIARAADGPASTQVSGFEGAPVAWRAVGELVAGVASLDREPAVELANLRVHDRVIRRLAEGRPAILPVRFGQVLAGEGELAECLARQAPRLEADLERVRGCEQMTWRVFGEIPPEPEPDPHGAGPGTRYLATRAARRSPPALDPLLAALAPWVRAQHIEGPRAGSLLASVYHLVRASDLETYKTELEQRRAWIAPLRLSVSGPWLPYAFAGGPAHG